MSTARCPQCLSRWQIIDDGKAGEVEVLCPNCPPPGQLIPLTFESCCPEPSTEGTR